MGFFKIGNRPSVFSILEESYAQNSNNISVINVKVNGDAVGRDSIARSVKF